MAARPRELLARAPGPPRTVAWVVAALRLRPLRPADEASFVAPVFDSLVEAGGGLAKRQYWID